MNNTSDSGRFERKLDYFALSSTDIDEISRKTTACGQSRSTI